MQLDPRCSIDATKIAPRLYQGSAPPIGKAVAQCGFDVLVLAAIEYQPPDELFPGAVVLRAPIDDAPIDRSSWRIALTAANRVASAVRKGQRVLVTCNMGMNRSGLIVALSIHILTGQDSKNVVQHIKRMRRGSLSNRSFVQAIQVFAG